MIGKSTLDITLRNIKLIFKLLLMTTVLLTILFVVLISIFSPVFDSLSDYLSEAGNIADADHLIAELLDRAGAQLQLFVQDKTSSVIATVGYTVLAIFVVKFVLSLTMVPTGAVLSTQMTTDFTEKYLTTSIQNIKKSFFYSLIGSLISILLDIPFSALIIYIAVCLAPSFSFFAYTVALILFVLYFAVRISLTSQWIPHIVLGGMSPFVAFCKTIKDTGATFKKVFVGNLCILSIIVLVTFSTIIVTAFASLAIIIPTFMVLFLVHNLVCYCHMHQQDYFVAENTPVIVKKEL